MVQEGKKIRADALLVQLGLAPTRTRAQSLIMSGAVYFGTERVEKPSRLFLPTGKLTVKGRDYPFVSRGGVKLQAALDHFKINVKGKICLDVGASTGGFTDCLLKAGARKIYALDVGYGQLDWSLRVHEKVVVLDRTNFRYFDPTSLEEPIDIITIDASFISLKKLLPKAVEIFLKNQEHSGTLIVLIKPQFEVGRKFVGKNGIVRDEEKRQQAVQDIHAFAKTLGFEIRGSVPSPITGQDGNQEYVMVAKFAWDLNQK